MAKFSDNPQYSDRFISALQWAAELHKYQVRKNGSPYIAHLLSVAALVLENGGSEDEAIAALLHDAVEDVKVKPSVIKKRFGEEVAAIVEAVTETKNQDDWLFRKLVYVYHLVAYSRKCNSSAAFVATCDKIHNMRSYLSDGVWSEKLLEFHQVFYSHIVQEFCSGMADDFQEVLDKLNVDN